MVKQKKMNKLQKKEIETVSQYQPEIFANKRKLFGEVDGFDKRLYLFF